MVRYLLNSAVITQPGTYSYRLITSVDAGLWLARPGWVSRVGYPANARFLESLVPGIHVPLSREATAMEAGDEALVVRLKYRLEDPTVKKGYEPKPDDWEFGLLRRIR